MPMPKHAGCFVCGGGMEEILTSQPDMLTMTSIAICRACYDLPARDLRMKVTRIREAMAKARREAAA